MPERRAHSATTGTMLLVEDDHDTQSLVRLALRRTCRVIVAANGEEARAELAARADVDLILMDVRLPGPEDGLALARSLRKSANWKTVPIVAATACTGQESLIRAVTSGCDGFLPKPFSAREVRNLVTRYLLR